MKCKNGIWSYRGRSYPTLHEALLAAWPSYGRFVVTGFTVMGEEDAK